MLEIFHTGLKTARIKFCGGCNPGYDRVETAERIRRQLKNAGYMIVTDKKEAEVLVVICGCACACADVSEIKCERKIMVTGPEKDAIIVRPPGQI